MISFKHTYFLLTLLLILNNQTGEKNTFNNNTPIKLLTTQKSFTVGDTISLEFSVINDTPVHLYCSNSYGSTILSSTKVKPHKVQFILPKFMSDKIGVVNWNLIQNEKKLFGNLTIVPNTEPKTLETYLGPPSIEAGGKDFAMMVIIPTDDKDNPIKKNSEVTIHDQFLASENDDLIYTDNLIAYKNIYSPTKSGRMLLSSNCLGLDSKEYHINVVPAIPVNFKIYAQRHHEYADGNQITTFKTSILKDSYGNIISDGSFVEFYITNLNGNILKTNGTTIDGVATAKIIHPDYEDHWLVKAYVIGISESDTLKLHYKKVIDSFEVHFSDTNRNLKVGPLKSFMNQMIPDGLEVKLSIYKEGKLVEEYLKESREGYVNFFLNQNIFNDGIYTLKIRTAGITQTYKNKKLW